MRPSNIIPWIDDRFKRSQRHIVVGIVLLLAISIGLIYLILTNRLRRADHAMIPTTVIETATSSTTLVPRRLDGILVPQGQEALMTRAVMVENSVDARPLSGPAKAQVVIEAPVEGGITRFMLLFDATTTVDEIGPVRSARPYYVDWASGWKALYAHVGGSPQALQMISQVSTFPNLDEMSAGKYFWRSSARSAPHNAYTSTDLLSQGIEARAIPTSTAAISWHTQDPATTTDRGNVTVVNIPYGGSYDVSWKYDKDQNVYTRLQAGRTQHDRDGSTVQSENVVVIETDAKVLDDVGRLQLRTLGGGPAIAYHDGKKYNIRWSRVTGEPIKFEGTDGAEFLLDRGRTWIEVTTDDRVFAGLSVTP